MASSKFLIAPSILSADFSKLGEEVRSVERAGADWIHVDVMDGHFVPNLTIGPVVVEALRPVTKLPLDCHLMVSRPEDWVGPFAEAGANIITVHAEATTHLDRLLHSIHERGCKAGVSINPGTSLALIEEVLDIVDLVLVMSVNPGFGGQKFIPSVISKIERLVEARAEACDGARDSEAGGKGRKFLIEVDGGVKASNIAQLARAGVDVFVAGSAIFEAKDHVRAFGELRGALKGAGGSKKS